MLSGYSTSPTPPSSDLDTSLSGVPEDFTETLDFISGPLKSAHGSGVFLQMFSEELLFNNHALLGMQLE